MKDARAHELFKSEKPVSFLVPRGGVRGWITALEYNHLEITSTTGDVQRFRIAEVSE